MKTLVVYFSRKGYVKKYAEEIARQENADIEALHTPERTRGFLGFLWCGRFNMHRWGMKIAPCEQDAAAYDKVILCAPIWVFTLCAPMRQYIFQNKKNIKSVEYVLFHFSFPMDYEKTCSWMDDALGIKHERLTSVCCMLGRRVRTRVYEKNGK